MPSDNFEYAQTLLSAVQTFTASYRLLPSTEHADNLLSMHSCLQDFLSAISGKPNSGPAICHTLLELEKAHCLDESLFDHVIQNHAMYADVNYILTFFNDQKFVLNKSVVTDLVPRLHKIINDTKKNPNIEFQINQSLPILARHRLVGPNNVIDLIDRLNKALTNALPYHPHCNIPHILNWLSLFNFLNQEAFDEVIGVYNVNDMELILNVESIGYVLRTIEETYSVDQDVYDSVRPAYSEREYPAVEARIAAAYAARAAHAEAMQCAQAELLLNLRPLLFANAAFIKQQLVNHQVLEKTSRRTIYVDTDTLKGRERLRQFFKELIAALQLKNQEKNAEPEQKQAATASRPVVNAQQAASPPQERKQLATLSSSRLAKTQDVVLSSTGNTQASAPPSAALQQEQSKLMAAWRNYQNHGIQTIQPDLTKKMTTDQPAQVNATQQVTGPEAYTTLAVPGAVLDETYVAPSKQAPARQVVTAAQHSAAKILETLDQSKRDQEKSASARRASAPTPSSTTGHPSTTTTSSRRTTAPGSVTLATGILYPQPRMNPYDPVSGFVARQQAVRVR